VIIRKGFEDKAGMFFAVAKGICEYSLSEHEPELAGMAAYMVCRKFGVPVDGEKVLQPSLGVLFGNSDGEIRNHLGAARSAFTDLADRIRKDLDRNRSGKTQER